jgi:hypothetical protein
MVGQDQEAGWAAARVLAITTTPMLSTLPRPPVTQRQKPLLIS